LFYEYSFNSPTLEGIGGIAQHVRDLIKFLKKWSSSWCNFFWKYSYNSNKKL